MPKIQLKATEIAIDDVHPQWGKVTGIRIRNDGRNIDIFFEDLEVKGGHFEGDTWVRDNDVRKVPMFCTPNTELELFRNEESS